MKFIVLIVIILAIVAIAQLMRVLELSNKLRDKKEEHIPRRYNEMNALGMLLFMFLFFGAFFWMTAEYASEGALAIPASEHGDEVKWLLDLNFYIVIAVFLVCNSLLFIFAFKYYARPGRKAYFFPHDNRLELAWTIVPSIVLAVIIILGLKSWNSIMGDAGTDAKVVEIYSEQFSWTARYAGEDNKLGVSDYKTQLWGSNQLGVVTSSTIDSAIVACHSQIDGLHHDFALMANGEKVVSDAEEKKLHLRSKRLGRILSRLEKMKHNHADSLDQYAWDDVITKELHLVKGQEYQFYFRAKDVIHSAFMPHFYVQMNTVPGMKTKFKMTPTISTVEMQEKLNNPKFDYILLCNKICGSAHSNMKMKIIVESQESFDQWMLEQKTFKSLITGVVEETPPENLEDESNKEVIEEVIEVEQTDSTEIANK